MQSHSACACRSPPLSGAPNLGLYPPVLPLGPPEQPSRAILAKSPGKGQPEAPALLCSLLRTPCLLVQAPMRVNTSSLGNDSRVCESDPCRAPEVAEEVIPAAAHLPKPTSLGSSLSVLTRTTTLGHMTHHLTLRSPFPLPGRWTRSHWKHIWAEEAEA